MRNLLFSFILIAASVKADAQIQDFTRLNFPENEKQLFIYCRSGSADSLEKIAAASKAVTATVLPSAGKTSTAILGRIIEQFGKMSLLSNVSIQLQSADDFPVNIVHVAGIRKVFFSVSLPDDEFSSGEARIRHQIIVKRNGTDDLLVECLEQPFYFDAKDEQMLKEKLERAGNSFVRRWDIVKPPVAGIDVPHETYRVNNSGDILRAGSGTILYIPQNAFVDEKGWPVNGAVTIQYREFRDPASIILSGIPMTYDSGGATRHFRTAGMFQIEASCNGKEVFLASGKKIEMDFVSLDSSQTYSFYQLNDSKDGQKGNWKNIGTANSQPVAANGQAWRLLALPPNPRSSDIKTLDELFEDPNYASVYRLSSTERYKNISKQYQQTNPSVYSYVYFKKVHTPAKMGTCFIIDPRCFSMFPELRNLKDITFILPEIYKRKTWDTLYGRGSWHTDVKLTTSNSQFTFELKSFFGNKTLTVQAGQLTKSGKFTDIPERILENHLRQYRKARAQRENDWLKSYGLDIKAYNKMLAAYDSASSWKKVKHLMTAREKQMDMKTFFVYADSMRRSIVFSGSAMYAALGNPPELVRRLSVSGMGIYNCDQVARLGRDAVTVYADFKTQDDHAVKNTVTYVVDKKINSILTYAGNYAGRNESYISFNPESPETTMIVIDKEGKVAIASHEKISGKRYKNNEHYSFTVDYIGSDTNYKELAESINRKK